MWGLTPFPASEFALHRLFDKESVRETKIEVIRTSYGSGRCEASLPEIHKQCRRQGQVACSLVIQTDGSLLDSTRLAFPPRSTRSLSQPPRRKGNAVVSTRVRAKKNRVVLLVHMVRKRSLTPSPYKYQSVLLSCALSSRCQCAALCQGWQTCDMALVGLGNERGESTPTIISPTLRAMTSWLK